MQPRCLLAHWLTGSLDWRQVKPKMHVRANGDPSPESAEYLHHVKCEHDGLALNVQNRRKISSRVREFLRDTIVNPF